MNYQLFIPPESLINKPSEEWTLSEAKEYKKWLLSIIDDRIMFMLDYFCFQLTENVANDLIRLGKKVTEELRKDEYSEDGQEEQVSTKTGHVIDMPIEIELTSEGYALAADMGLLVAKLVVEKNDNTVYWDILRKPKNSWGYNMPVLQGFKDVFFEPVGASIVKSIAIINNQENHGVWKKMYEFCNSKVL